MRATVSQFGPAQAAEPIRGTFVPDAAGGRPTVPTVLPRVLAVMAGVVFMRALARMARHHGGHASGRERRMERLVRLHRDLHQREDGAAQGAEGMPS
jgi:hypothetical protein